MLPFISYMTFPSHRLFHLLLLISLFGSAVFAQIAVNTDNWCRQGLFTVDSRDFGVSFVKGGKGTKTYFYGDDSERCPESVNCRTKSYVVSGDTVITNRKRGDYVCAWYSPLKGSPTVGWLKASDLDSPEMLSDASEKVWVGEWLYADNNIIFAPTNQPDTLNVKGNAFWKGFGDNIHIGEIDGVATYKEGTLEYSDGTGKYDCRVSMQLATEKFLIVADNMNCGGANVTFSGIYRKNSAKRKKN